MKLSKIKGERVIETIANIIEPIGNIMSDSETKKFIQRDESQKKILIFKILPTLLKSHKNDIYQILAVINDVTIEEYIKNSNMITIMNDFADVVMDETVQSLFISAKPVEVEN